MSKPIEVVYESGGFRLVGNAKVHLDEGERVRITIEKADKDSDARVLELAGAVYDGLAESEIDEIESVATDRSRFFTDDPESR